MTENIYLKTINSYADYLKHNYVLLDIYEGRLSPYIIEDLKDQLSMQSFEQAIKRLVPINVLPKIIDKLTNIYQTSVTREVIDGNDTDKESLAWYEEKTNINVQMNCANELYNLCKSTLIHPYVYDGIPQIRVIQNDRFIVMSMDRVNPTVPTHVIIFAGRKNNKDIFWIYSANEFFVMDSSGDIDHEEMARLGMEDGVNPYGILPFVYANQSKYNLMPIQNTDTLRMTKVIPIMLTDLNLAAMFQSFTILYGLDLNAENLKYAPNAFWFLKSDPTTDKTPQIGTIKPEVDFQEVLNLVQSELSMWLGTMGIRASSVGQLTAETFASGISKVIDEMDTYEARQKQTKSFLKAEDELWKLIFNHMHPYWVKNNLIENKALFSPSASVITNFAIQLPMQTRGQVVRDLKEEYMSGFTTRARVLKTLNPEMSNQEVEDLENEIDEERGFGSEDQEIKYDSEGNIIDTQTTGAQQSITTGAQQSMAIENLNGAQVESLVILLEKVQTGLLPKESAKSALKAAFNFTDEQVNEILDPIKSGSISVESIQQTKQGVF